LGECLTGGLTGTACAEALNEAEIAKG